MGNPTSSSTPDTIAARRTLNATAVQSISARTEPDRIRRRQKEYESPAGSGTRETRAQRLCCAMLERRPLPVRLAGRARTARRRTDRSRVPPARVRRRGGRDRRPRYQTARIARLARRFRRGPASLGPSRTNQRREGQPLLRVRTVRVPGLQSRYAARDPTTAPRVRVERRLRNPCASTTPATRSRTEAACLAPR